MNRHCTGNNLMYFKNDVEFKAGETCIQKFVLTGAESIPDVDVGKRRFALNIILPSSDDTGEIRLVFENVCFKGVTIQAIVKPGGLITDAKGQRSK